MTPVEIRLECMKQAVQLCMATREFNADRVATVSKSLYDHVMEGANPSGNGRKQKGKSRQPDPFS